MATLLLPRLMVFPSSTFTGGVGLKVSELKNAAL